MFAIASIIARTRLLRYVSVGGLLSSLSPFGNDSAVAGLGPDQADKIRLYFDQVERAARVTTLGDFPSKLEWFNSKPLSMRKELKGKILVLDFWTYCCINCMHILPDLKFLEDKYKNEAFAVVGVHSAKFDNEQDSENIRQAVLRYEVAHPVVNDPDMKLWGRLGVDAWPTLLLISPRSGRVLARLNGENHRQDLDVLVSVALEYYAQDLNATPLPLTLEKDKDVRTVQSPLRFPGKIALDVAGQRLFISDSNNNRVVITDLEGRFIDHVGSGAAGLRDGSFEEAQFNRLQGVSYDPTRNVLYVADTENHALREVDLTEKSVRTLAGDGTQGDDYEGGAQDTAQKLSSPWDVAVGWGGKVFIAMAGTHQIWAHDNQTRRTFRLAGSGRELNYNSSSKLAASGFAQPSGLAVDEENHILYVADSESSSVRLVDEPNSKTETIVGGDSLLAQNLFAFGDEDGKGDKARLQHPLAVLLKDSNTVFVADSYNHKIKVLDVASATIQTFAGDGTAGYKDGPASEARFSEPAGLALSADGNTLYVADTNNFLIRKVDLATKEVSTLALSGVPPPRSTTSASSSQAALTSLTNPRSTVVMVDPPVPVPLDKEVTLMLDIRLPEGYKYTKGARSRWQILVDPSSAAEVVGNTISGDFPLNKSPAPIAIPIRLKSPFSAMVRLEALVYYCRTVKTEVCLVDSVAFEVPLSPDEGPMPVPDKVPIAYVVKEVGAKAGQALVGSSMS